MIIVKDKKVQEFCKENKLKFKFELEVFIANRVNAESRNKLNLLIEVKELQDFMKQKNSAIDQVFCKIAKEKNKNIFFDLNEILDSKNKEKIISRIKQNIKLLKKYKLKYEFLYICNSITEIISNKDILSLQVVLEEK